MAGAAINDLLELLESAVGEMNSLIGMMEPYYSQCDADKNARALIEKIKRVLPPEPEPYVAPPITCDLCTGRSKRTFKTSNALKMHQAHVHFEFPRQEAKP